MEIKKPKHFSAGPTPEELKAEAERERKKAEALSRE